MGGRRVRFDKATILALGLSSALLSGPVRAEAITGKEAKAAAMSAKWRTAAGVTTTGPDGKVIFLYGASQPSVVCSPLQVCDIELQSGEIVRDVLVGDTVRWKIEAATSGAAGDQAIHLVVKPSEPGITTSMVVTTSRRTYHLQLKSHPTHYMARVGFAYPEDRSASLADANARLEAGNVGVTAEALNFTYTISGRARWKPTRVYSDGQKTYIQFPKSISSQDAPVLFVVSGGQNRTVNYRMKHGLMTVDVDIDRAVLISGVGWHQEKITIKRGG